MYISSGDPVNQEIRKNTKEIRNVVDLFILSVKPRLQVVDIDFASRISAKSRKAYHTINYQATALYV